ncbi:MAG TPA: glycosyltransferase [Gemmatimonadales bacterium]|nr:glycosyltransferase [Gemmatimonadales bacterium]
MIDVVHVTTGLDLGGAEVLLADLVTRSDQSSFRHRVVSLLPDGVVRRRLEHAGIPVTDLGMRHARPSLSALLQLRRIVRDARPALVHAWMYHACFAAALTRPRRMLWGLHAANLDLSRYPLSTTLATAACRMLSRVPHAIVVNSATTRDYHRDRGYKPRQWELIPNGIDTDAFRPDAGRRRDIRASLGMAEGTWLIGFIARRDPQKDHVTFLRAAARLTERKPDVQFLLAGLGTDDALMRDLVRRYAPRSTIHLLGIRNDVAAVTTALDVATMCSFGESFSNAVVEAMACGVPCVVSNVPPLPELVGQTGAVVAPEDPDALAGAWAALLDTDPAERRNRGETARRRVSTQFSVRAMVNRFEALYRTVDNGH